MTETRSLQLAIPVTTGGIGVGMQHLESFLEESGVAFGLAYNLGLAYEELASNIVKYGFDGNRAPDSEQIRVFVTINQTRPQTANIRIEDGSHPYDPFAQAPEPDVDADAEDRAIGGLGIHLLRQLALRCHYERNGNKNITTLEFADQEPIE